MELSCPGLFASLSIGKKDLCKIAGHGEKPLKTNSFDPTRMEKAVNRR